jgi:pseudouridine-5'-monophosphatase
MSSFSPVTHVIFDLDGLLVDSESLITTAIENVAKKHNKKLTFEVKQKLIGYPFKVRAQQLLEEIGFDLNLGEFINELIADCIKNVTENGMKLMPGVEKIVNYFKENNIPMAIASGNTSQSYKETVERFGNFFNNFSHAVLSGDDKEVSQPKPNPDIYLVTAQRFANKPKSMEQVLVFEDTQVGVDAAIRAGMQCVFVFDERLNANSSSKNATIVINSMNEFKPEMFHLPKL